ncbi:uncharacterized protein L3040_005112 [Drepanopeziza brunnea f. sp. 'multigermtubi']|uniref:Metalloprotease n=1 Tax=Marssonina brunnea f. sp. multigermtubi (strain MB_m1) TaxID=1072389 RepID=K1XMD0_MARBU|nr:metalloprotease [Drepanopeziza brunnea f. sp. 'multigermtubi' MB_m1]EKD13624.1 metalloprotease [Drepanopeziza brunnea f. sp. 'multigermtubi' MB_m1]KAJ5041527.1 hypothetical protein L3040_005112 [Drepanopeziza brunnea f. sp. 'multigermtubi']
MAHFNLLALALAAVSAISAHPTNAPRAKKFGCGVEPTAQFLAQAQVIAAEEAANSTRAAQQRSTNVAATVTIQTYFHVVARSSAASEGYIPVEQLTQQLAVMNADYASSGFQFALAGTDYTINKSWASDGAELTMKRALRKGDYKALNIYFQYEIGGNFGYCYFPNRVSRGSSNFYYDGCTVLYSTVPGGSATDYNLGKTVTHEVGHWFGLFHTFQGNSCSGSGDSIADTPQQLSSTTGCPVGRDSCPNAAGVDPIHNYMDYSSDSCYESFTANQITRMSTYYNMYRA